MIRVHFFAGLKRYFPEAVEIDLAGVSKIEDLIEQLKQNNAEATELLEKCRVAVDETFVSLDTSVEGLKEVFIIPPSSGG